MNNSTEHHDHDLYVNIMQNLIGGWNYKVKDAAEVAAKVVSDRKFNEKLHSHLDLSLYNNIVLNIVGQGMLVPVDGIIKMANDAVSEKHKFFNKVVSKKSNKKVK